MISGIFEKKLDNLGWPKKRGCTSFDVSWWKGGGAWTNIDQILYGTIFCDFL